MAAVDVVHGVWTHDACEHWRWSCGQGDVQCWKCDVGECPSLSEVPIRWSK